MDTVLRPYIQSNPSLQIEIFTIHGVSHSNGFRKKSPLNLAENLLEVRS